VVTAFAEALAGGFHSTVEISCIRALRHRDAAINALAVEAASD
jgi:hypothetical protein